MIGRVGLKSGELHRDTFIALAGADVFRCNWNDAAVPRRGAVFELHGCVKTMRVDLRYKFRGGGGKVFGGDPVDGR